MSRLPSASYGGQSLETFKIYSVLIFYLPIVVLLFWLVDSVRIGLRKGLRTLPGPFLARISGLYRLSLVYRGDAPQQYRKVHEKYGPVVRVGPNHVSVADPSMIPVIYGIGSGFLKVKSCLPLKVTLRHII